MTEEDLLKEEYKAEERASRATHLAAELSKERKRLKAELAELSTQVEDLTPTTPTGTPDWYVKWTATLLAVIGVFILSAGLIQYGQILYLISSICWVYVGIAWGDRAIMIGSSISGTAVAMNLVNYYVG